MQLCYGSDTSRVNRQGQYVPLRPVPRHTALGGAAMEIVPGVHAIDRLGVGRAYLYQEGDPSTSLRASRLTLIDTGLAGSAERIFAAIERLGRQPEDLRQIVITHYPPDPTGALAAGV